MCNDHLVIFHLSMCQEQRNLSHYFPISTYLLDILEYLKCESTILYVSLRLRVQNAVPAQPCVGKLEISLVLLNFLHCNFRLWFKTP